MPSLLVAQGSCFDTGKACVPGWQLAWFYLGSVVVVVTTAAYWRVRTRKVSRLISELGKDEFYEVARARREQRRPDPITARLLWGLLLAFSVGAAGLLGNLVNSLFMAADVFFTIWCVALTVATIRNDWWLFRFRTPDVDRRPLER